MSKVLQSRELENAFKSHSCSSCNFEEKRRIRIPGRMRITKAFLISFSGLNCIIGEDGRQSAHHNVCCPRSWVEHDQPEWNEPFREYFPEFLCDLPRAANPNYSDFVGDARCGRIRNHERLVNSPRRSRVCSRANKSILAFFFTEEKHSVIFKIYQIYMDIWILMHTG